MNQSAWVFVIFSLAASAIPAVAAEPANDVMAVAQGLALSVQGARSAAGRDAQGQVKWAGVWMDENQVCDQGKLNPAGQRVVQAGQRYVHDNGARMTLFTPPESAPSIGREMAGIAPEAVVQPNALIGRHCYLVISK